MGGGLMQLVAYGAQDIYLTGNPQITFFKVVYRRHTNFSMEAIAQTFSGAQAASARVTSTISRNGDLISKMYYTFNATQLRLTGGGGGALLSANVGHALFNEIKLEIGGQEIDRHYGHWLTVWNELTDPNPLGTKTVLAANFGAEPGVSTLYQRMTYNHQGGNNINAVAAGPNAIALTAGPVHCSIPFQFWFNRNPGLALPLIALQYHEVKVHITFSAVGAVTGGGGFGPDPNGQLWVDYIYLDTDERRRFAQQSHEYLIEQLQFQQTAAGQNSQLNFNHPVKELIWTGQPAAGAVATPGSQAALPVAVGNTVHIRLNGHDRFAARHQFYFTRTQVHQHHSGFGGVTTADSIAVYSFALKPEEHQPSGTCNFSRIDNAQLVQTGANAALNVYAVNYNVLRIMSGMGGLAYSN